MSAKQIYRMWHAKEADEFFSVKEKLLDEDYACEVGTATDIVYQSAKWEKVPHRYHHEFKNPSIYFVDSQTREGEGTGKIKKVRTLLATRSDKPEFAFLGEVEALQYCDCDGEEVNLGNIKGAALLCTPDKKGLLILSKKGPIFIRGGSMRVTHRGIVD